MVDQTDTRVYNTKHQKTTTEESTEEDLVVIESKSADELNIEKMNNQVVVNLCSPLPKTGTSKNNKDNTAGPGGGGDGSGGVGSGRGGSNAIFLQQCYDFAHQKDNETDEWKKKFTVIEGQLNEKETEIINGTTALETLQTTVNELQRKFDNQAIVNKGLQTKVAADVEAKKSSNKQSVRRINGSGGSGGGGSGSGGPGGGGDVDGWGEGNGKIPSEKMRGILKDLADCENELGWGGGNGKIPPPMKCMAFLNTHLANYEIEKNEFRTTVDRQAIVNKRLQTTVEADAKEKETLQTKVDELQAKVEAEVKEKIILQQTVDRLRAKLINKNI